MDFDPRDSDSRDESRCQCLLADRHRRSSANSYYETAHAGDCGVGERSTVPTGVAVFARGRPLSRLILT